MIYRKLDAVTSTVYHVIERYEGLLTEADRLETATAAREIG
jgi:hypothetical protein